MDKELNSIADDIIKDSFGSAVPEAPETPPSSSTMPVMNGNRRTQAPSPSRSNEYSRIKEQMTSARENSSLPNVNPTVMSQTKMPKDGLNKAIIFFIIFIPVIVVVAGVIVALLNQPDDSKPSSSTNNTHQTTSKPNTISKPETEDENKDEPTDDKDSSETDALDEKDNLENSNNQTNPSSENQTSTPSEPTSPDSNANPAETPAEDDFGFQDEEIPDDFDHPGAAEE